MKETIKIEWEELNGERATGTADIFANDRDMVIIISMDKGNKAFAEYDLSDFAEVGSEAFWEIWDTLKNGNVENVTAFMASEGYLG